MDDVTIVDDMAMSAVRLGRPRRKTTMGVEPKAFQPIVVQAHRSLWPIRREGTEQNTLRSVKALELVTSMLTSS